jgi:hypothetical protein
VTTREHHWSLGKHAREVHAARRADVAAVYRERRRLKLSAEYQKAGVETKKIMWDEVGKMVLQDRSLSLLTIVFIFGLISHRTKRGYSASLVISAKKALLDQHLRQDQVTHVCGLDHYNADC